MLQSGDAVGSSRYVYDLLSFFLLCRLGSIVEHVLKEIGDAEDSIRALRDVSKDKSRVFQLATLTSKAVFKDDTSS